MSKRKRFEEDEQPYEPSDSDDVLSDSEKILLEKARKGRKSFNEDSEDEVFGVGPGDSSDDGEEEQMSDSDIEGKGEEDDDLPDVRAWGKKKRDYYNTDYVDQDHGGYNEKDVEAAEREEEEARAIQKRLVEQLDDADFSLEIFNKKPVEKETEVQEVIKSDLGKMSKRQKMALMQKESPEFFGLVEDFRTNMKELQDRLDPIVTAIKEAKIPTSPIDSYVQTKYHLVLNYCTNILFYLLLKAKRVPVQSHPVVRRLYQFRQLLKQLEPVDEVALPQIDVLLEKLNAGEDINPAAKETNAKTKKSRKKMLKLISHLNEETKNSKKTEETLLPVEEDKPLITAKQFDEDTSEEDEAVNKDTKEEEKEGDEEERRAITYQIAKNKGLTPYRKKENRNPRVKHRNKFRKAKIRRKGQIREPRKELAKYGGEISGIKIGVVKSVKLK